MNLAVLGLSVFVTIHPIHCIDKQIYATHFTGFAVGNYFNLGEILIKTIFDS